MLNLISERLRTTSVNPHGAVPSSVYVAGPWREFSAALRRAAKIVCSRTHDPARQRNAQKGKKML